MAKYIRSLIALTLFTYCFVLTGCDLPPAATFVAPESGSFHETAPTVEIEFSSTPSSIRLNNSDITQFFELTETSGTADISQFENYLRQGDNSLTVRASGKSKASLKFSYDSDGPLVVIDEVQGAGPITIQGTLVDPAGVDQLSINGDSVLVDENGQFATQTAKAATYRFEATDALGKTSETIIAAPDEEFERIITTRISQEGIDFIAAEMIPILQDADTSPLLPDVNRELKETLERDLALVALFVDIEITAMSWQAMEATMDLKPDSEKGLIGFNANTYETLVDLNIIDKQGNTLPARAHMSRAQIAGDVEVRGVSGQLDLSISNMSLAPEGISIELNGQSNAILDALANLLLPAMGGVMTVLVDGVVNGVLSHALEEAADEILVDLDGRQLGMKPLFQGFSSDDDSLHLIIGGAMSAKSFDPGTPQVLGSLYSEDELPEATYPDSHLYANVSSNMINQALMVAFQTGLMHFTLLDGEELLRGTEDRGEDRPNGTQRILITSGSPASVSIDELLGDPVVSFALNGLQIALENKSSDEYRSWFQTEVDVAARVVLAVNEDSSLRIDFAGEPGLTIRNTEIFDTIEVNDSFVANMVDRVMPQVLPKIAEATRSIEIPEMGGFKLNIDEFAAVGANSSHLGVGATLSYPGAIVCPEGSERYGQSCYGDCRDGFIGIGDLCWSPKQYQYIRGFGRFPGLACETGEEMQWGSCFEPCEPGYTGLLNTCWLNNATYPQGAGRPVDQICSEGEYIDFGKCYTPCVEGFHPVLGWCENDLPEFYNRPGTPSTTNPFSCPPGDQLIFDKCYPPCAEGYSPGFLAACALDNPRYARYSGTPVTYSCNEDEEQVLLSCLPRCAEGYTSGFGICWADQPHSYKRASVPATKVCSDGRVLEDGFCFVPCQEDFIGVGAVCYPPDLTPYHREPLEVAVEE